jgi:hypothetical protein
MQVRLLNLDSVCWLLVSRCGVRVPAMPWALGDAVSWLGAAAPPTGALASARLPKTGPAADPQVAAAVRRLASSGRLVRRGAGWSAGYVSTGDPLALTSVFDPAEAAVVEQAVQRLNAMATIWSKKSAA